jgi:signal recognition particle subunit SRP54
MAFEGLSEKLNAVFSKLKQRGKLTEADVKVALREVRLALLEADVNFLVVKEFVAKVRERAVGSEVLESLTPGQQVIKIVNEELTALMGRRAEKIVYSSNPPTVIMLCGLQGAGKTTTAAKLAKIMKEKDGKRPILVGCDIYRPAAMKQLQVVGESVGVPVFIKENADPVKIAKESIKEAKHQGRDVVILDTAGRLSIDEALMDEIENIKDEVKPNEILLVLDSMTGQDAVNTAKAFDEKVDITGAILTKLDGDTRGGAALSMRHVTGKPIKYATVGEKLSDIEAFHPDRMANRILGMGDVLTLIEKAEEAFDEQKAEALQKKMKNASFTLEDYLEQFEQVKNMGGISSILSMMPGAKGINADDIDEKQIEHVKALILSMTPEERRKPKVLDASRRRRIAKGAGLEVQDLNRLIKQFEQTKVMMKRMSKGKMGRGGMPFGMPF